MGYKRFKNKGSKIVKMKGIEFFWNGTMYPSHRQAIRAKRLANDTGPSLRFWKRNTRDKNKNKETEIEKELI